MYLKKKGKKKEVGKLIPPLGIMRKTLGSFPRTMGKAELGKSNKSKGLLI